MGSSPIGVPSSVSGKKVVWGRPFVYVGPKQSCAAVTRHAGDSHANLHGFDPYIQGPEGYIAEAVRT